MIMRRNKILLSLLLITIELLALSILVVNSTTSSTYTISFVEYGLPLGSTWSVTLNGQTKVAYANENITFYEPNGNYQYIVNSSLLYYNASISKGNITVNNEDVSQTIFFTLSTNHVFGYIPVIPRTTGLAYDPQNKLLYVPIHNYQSYFYYVYIINTSVNQVINGINLNNFFPYSIIYDPQNNLLYLTGFYSQSSYMYGLGLEVINPSTNKIICSGILQPYNNNIYCAYDAIIPLYDPNNNLIYIADPATASILAIAPQLNNSLVANISISPGNVYSFHSSYSALTYDPDNNLIYVADYVLQALTVINPLTEKVIANIPLPYTPYGVTVDTKDNLIYVAGSNGILIVNGITNEIQGNININYFDPSYIMYDSINNLIYADGNGLYIINASNNNITNICYSEGGWIDMVYDQNNHIMYFVSAGGSAVGMFYPPNINYNVTFEETGLPNGTHWSVTLNTMKEASSSSNITFNVPNGTYLYTINVQNSGYNIITPKVGTIIVNGNNVIIDVKFVPNITTYPITFEAVGLPKGLPWSVTLSGTSTNGQFVNITQTSDENTIKFNLTSGTYFYVIRLPSGYHTNQLNGSITVTNSPQVIKISVMPTETTSTQTQTTTTIQTSSTSVSTTTSTTSSSPISSNIALSSSSLSSQSLLTTPILILAIVSLFAVVSGVLVFRKGRNNSSSHSGMMATQPVIRPIYSGVIRSNGILKLYLDSNIVARIISVSVAGTNLIGTNVSPNTLNIGQNTILVTLNTVPQGLVPNSAIYQTVLTIEYNKQTFTISIPTYYIP